jgi:hypothetical protein
MVLLSGENKVRPNQLEYGKRKVYKGMMIGKMGLMTYVFRYALKYRNKLALLKTI